MSSPFRSRPAGFEAGRPASKRAGSCESGLNMYIVFKKYIPHHSQCPSVSLVFWFWRGQNLPVLDSDIIWKYGSTFNVGKDQVQNGHLYLRYESNFVRTTAKWDKTLTHKKPLLFYCKKCPKSSASSCYSSEKRTWKSRFCSPSFFPFDRT